MKKKKAYIYSMIDENYYKAIFLRLEENGILNRRIKIELYSYIDVASINKRVKHYIKLKRKILTIQEQSEKWKIKTRINFKQALKKLDTIDLEYLNEEQGNLLIEHRYSKKQCEKSKKRKGTKIHDGERSIFTSKSIRPILIGHPKQ